MRDLQFFPRATQMKGLVSKCESIRHRLENEKVELNMGPLRAIVRNSVDLFPHQIVGVEFLASLYRCGGMGGILADEMGLGKTLQTLVFLAWLKEVERVNPPFVVVCPLTLVDNWVQETNKFTTLAVVAYKGNTVEREALRSQISQNHVDIVVTSYEYALKGELSSLSWGYMVVDEGHRLKNAESQLYKVLLQVFALLLMITSNCQC